MSKKTQQKKITAAQLDHKFDSGEDILKYADLSKKVEKYPTKKVNVDFPEWLLELIDAEAARLCINRQALIKTVLANAFSQD